MLPPVYPEGRSGESPAGAAMRAAERVPLARLLDDCRQALAQSQPPPLSPRAYAALGQAGMAAVPVAAGGWRVAGRLDSDHRRRWPLALLATGALMLALAWAATRWPGTPVPVLPLPGVISGFVPVVPIERWQSVLGDAPGGTAWLVNAEMSRDRLAALGLPFDPARAGDAVPAQLLLHASGEVLAVRVLQR